MDKEEKEEVEKFTKQYLASFSEQVTKLLSSPTGFQEVLKSLTNMQEQCLNSDPGSEEENTGDLLRFSGENNELVARIANIEARLTKLEAKFAKVKIKPRSGSDGNIDNSTA